MALPLLVLLFFSPKPSRTQTEFRFAQAAELATILESSFCATRPDNSVCNEPQGKICSSRKCVSLCDKLSTVACACTKAQCTVCCYNGTKCTPAAALGLYDSQGRSWYKQSTAQSCLRAVAGYGSLCLANEDGKICDTTFKPGTYIEDPWVCKRGSCVRLHCEIDGNNMVMCPCEGKYEQYPHCCKRSINSTCLPYQWWLRNVPDGNRNSNSATCLGKADGERCGLKHVCDGFSCNHVCGGVGETECICSASSTHECKICCWAHNLCTTNSYGLLRPIGSLCNYTFGTCDQNAQCNSVDIHPLRLFCSRPQNDGSSCAKNSYCVKGECRHVCGQPAKECACAPGSTEECRICCMNDAGQCLAASRLINREQGTPCNFSFGVCSEGQCLSIGRLHPYFDHCQLALNEGKFCGAARRCKKGKCAHVCRLETRACRCSAGTSVECHTCCLEDGRCRSVFDSKSRDLLQMPGSSCNFTFGQCDMNGICQRRPEHPSKQLCDYIENAGNLCGPKHVCRDYQCSHVCGTPQAECRCAVGSQDECHYCCMTNGQCRSVYDNKSPFLLQSLGTPCNLTRGICNALGTCEPLSTFCSQSKNDGLRCGVKHNCAQGSCKHVCGEEQRECICEPESLAECQICCLNIEGGYGNETCTSMYNSWNAAHLVRPFGTACNFTRGICVENGTCDSVLNHPFYVQKLENRVNLNFCLMLLLTVVEMWFLC